MGKAGECNGQERQEASEFSRVASIPRDGAWTQTWGLLARRWDRRSWATLSGKELVEWRLGAGDTPGHTFRNTVTYSLLGSSPQTQGFLKGSLLSLSWMGWLPPRPGRRVGNKEIDCSLTWHPEAPACLGAHWVHTIYLALNHTTVFFL